jgi:polyisoprenoid-binding protein YceI
MNSPRRHPRWNPAGSHSARRIVGLFLLSAALGPAAHAANSFILQPESRLWLAGTSTLHPYSSTSTLTQISVDLAPDTASQATLPVDTVLSDIAHRAPFQRFEVVIPVKGLKSGESGLDKNMYKALKADRAPEIRFTLTRYESSLAADGSLPFRATGPLSIGGVQKDITLEGTAKPGPTELLVEGQYRLLMSDYGIKPPTLMLGAIKVHDPVIIHFHLVFQISNSEATTSPINNERGHP